MKYLAAIALGLAMSLAAVPAMAAAEAVPEWRTWWDLAWRILNFLILAGLIVKLAKKPLSEFLKGQKAAHKEELDAMELAKAEAEAKYQEIKGQTANLAEELAEHEKLLTESAEREQERILSEAKKDSGLIIERAELWADQELTRARQRLAKEMMELASNIAAEKIAATITAEDRHRLVDEFQSQVVEAAG